MCLSVDTQFFIYYSVLIRTYQRGGAYGQDYRTGFIEKGFD